VDNRASEELTCARAIYELMVGEKLFLRVHGQNVSVERLPDGLSEGQARRQYRVSRGRRSRRGTEMWIDGKWQEIHSWTALSPGTRLRFGKDDGRIFVVPALGHSQTEIITEKRGGSGSSAHDHIDTTVTSTISLFARNGRRDSGRLAVAPFRAQLLGEHIADGLKALRAGALGRVVAHFSRVETLQMCGQHEFVARIQALPGLNEVDFFTSLLPQGVSQQHENLQKEIAVLYAQEWLYVYQKVLGRNISKKGVFIAGEFCAQQDAAQFLREQHIPLSRKLYLSQFERLETLARLEGIQIPEQVEQISAALALLHPGQEVTVGRGEWATIKIERPDIGRYLKAHPLLSGLPDTAVAKELISVAYTQLSRIHCRLRRQENGLFLLSDGDASKPSSNGVFVPDELGILRRQKEAVELNPGTKIWLGRSFELKLPEG